MFRIVFWVGVPLGIAAALFWPRRVVLYVGGDAPEFNRPPSRLPCLMADLAYLYPASILGVAALTVTTGSRLLRGRRRGRGAASLPAYFLPTYVAGIEATGHVQWASRCHSWAADFDLPAYVLGEAYTCAIALTITVIAGTAAAAALGHRSRFGIPIPPVVGAICASVAGPWWVLLQLVST